MGAADTGPTGVPPPGGGIPIGTSTNPLQQDREAVNGLSVLLLEDHPFQRRTMVRSLLEIGQVAVVEASTGEEALEAVRRAVPDLVIADLETPGMDGITFLRMLASEPVHPRVVLTSSHDRSVLHSVEQMARLYGLTVLGAIPKPIPMLALRSFVAEARRDDRRSSPADGRRATPPRPLGVDEIAAAIANGQLYPAFQPKIEVATGRLTGVEALARWRHPEYGLLSPASFLPQIETHPLMNELSHSMLVQSLGWLRRWEGIGLSISVSVNLLGGSLADPMLADRLGALVRGLGVQPSSLIIEVTETTISRERALAIETFARLRLAGFGLSLDDYGTGYASMEMLKAMPVTEVKVDQRFVTGAGRDPKASAVLASLIELAASLDLPAVAEGVETAADLDLLRALRCPLAQGFAIGRPMGGDELLQWAAQRGQRPA